MKKQETNILVMPTWRIWLDDNIENTLYFKKWSSLLNNKNLINFIEENNITIYFTPHKKASRYLNKFKIKFEKVISFPIKFFPTEQIEEDIKLLIDKIHSQIK